ncbi:MAG: cobalamin-dependent protein [Candidatus Aminicenantes bacterium]|nr:cobalamin-dependent protein [Candidatus Aminicenantes bacterium]
MRKVLLTTEYEPVYSLQMADGKLMDLCDGNFIVSHQDELLALSSNRKKKLSLHLMAANMGVPVKVLEHPTKKLFIRTIKENNFDDIGFSTIVPSLEKVEEMIKICRKFSPTSRIIIGGHGVDHEKARNIGADIICRGDGISFMQKLMGTETKGFHHPALPFRHTLKSLRRIPYSNKLAEESLVILCGVGCPMGCEYCPATSFYDRKRFSFMDGPSLVETILRLKEKHPKANFFLWDQDFLLDKKRAIYFGQAIQTYNSKCTNEEDIITWATQASIKTISSFDYDELFDYGCRFLAIGVENSEELWEKRKGEEPHKLFRKLHERGIGSFAFFIIGWENHDTQRTYEEVNYLLSLDPTINHFTLLTPEPGTAFYKELKEQNRLLDLPPRCFNYGTLLFKHPLITSEEAKAAFTHAYKSGTKKLGATILRVLKIKFYGYRYATNRFGADSVTALAFKNEIRGMLPILYLIPFYYPKGESKRLCMNLRKEAKLLDMKLDLKTCIKSLILNVIFSYKKILWSLFGVPLEKWKQSEYNYPNQQ